MMAVTIIAIVLPLGVDTFAVSLTLGIGGASIQQRMRTGLLFTGFEATMPLVGVAIGRGLGNALGGPAGLSGDRGPVRAGDPHSAGRWGGTSPGVAARSRHGRIGCAWTFDQSR